MPFIPARVYNKKEKVGFVFVLKGKKVEWLAKNGWQMAREARRFSTWQSEFEEIF